jgi:uncharacterized phage protein gp47/JayE
MAAPGDYLRENLIRILGISNVDHIGQPSDMLDATNRDLMYDFLANTRSLVDSLSNIEKPSTNLLWKDFYSLFIERVNIVLDKFVDGSGNPIWTDFSESNIGTIFLELGAAEDDKFYYILDQIFTQTILDLISNFYYAHLKAKEASYQIKGREVSRCILTFILSASHSQDVIIPRLTPVSTSEGGYTFYTTEYLTIPAGSVRTTVEAVNGLEYTETFASTGLPKQRFRLSYAPVVPSSIAITTGSSQWDSKTHLFSSRSDDRHYVYERDVDDYVTVVFGDGKNGLIPTGNITVVYLAGGGSAANAIQRNQINTIDVKIYDSVSQPVNDIRAYNSEQPSGGKESESIEDIKRGIKVHNRALGRSIILDDFEDYAETVSGVVRAFAVDRPRSQNEQLNLVIGKDEVRLFIVPETVTTLSTTLIEEIQRMFLEDYPPEEQKTVVPTISLYQTIDIEGKLYFDSNSNYSANTQAIKTAIQDYFKYTRKELDGSYTQDWGYKKPTLSKSKLIALIETFANVGLKGVELTLPAGDVSIDPIKIPSLGSMNNLIPVDESGSAL